MARQVTGWWDGPGPPGVDGRMGRYCRSPKQARSAVCTVTRAWGEFRAPSPGAPGTLSTLASPVVALKLRLWCAQLGQVAGLQASTVLLALFRPLRPSCAAGATIRHRGSLFSLHFCARQQISRPWASRTLAQLTLPPITAASKKVSCRGAGLHT